MGVIAAEGAREPTVRARPGVPLAVAVGLLAALAIAVGSVPSSPIGHPGVVEPLDTGGRWVPWTTVDVTAFEAVRFGRIYLLRTQDRLVTLDETGATAVVDLEGMVRLRGVTTDGEQAVAFGADRTGPALWTTVDTGDWSHVPLPWAGAVQTVAIVDGALVALGIDRVQGGRQIAATSSGEPGAVWTIRKVDVPDTAVAAVRGGFVGYGRTVGDDAQYLFSADGAAWTPFARSILRPVGEIAAVVDSAHVRSLRVVGDARLVTPPEWPVAALWKVDDRIWVQTPSAAWWSADGTAWNRIPLDRSHGIEGGIPTMLPFRDRLAVAMDFERMRSWSRDVLVWTLGG